MKNLFTLSILLFAVTFSNISAQTTAMDFNRKDCNGVQRHLFADLDSGNAVIIEYFMINCAPCPAAAQYLKSMKSNLLSQYPGKVVSYAIAFNNTYSQAVVNNWVSTNGLNVIPMDSGATQVAYYGGMGMPTIVILAGKSTHSVLGAPYIGFNNSDTTEMATNIRNYLKSSVPTNTTGLKENQFAVNLQVFPNPASKEISISFSTADMTDVNIYVTDINGKVIKSVGKSSSQVDVRKTIDISDIPSGTYFVNVQSQEKIATRKITVSN